MEISSVLPDIGAGGIIGFVTGYAASIIMKVVIVAIGLYFGSLMYLNHRGLIEIKEKAFMQLFNTTGTKNLILNNIAQKITAIAPFGGGFVAGFYLGFKKA